MDRRVQLPCVWCGPTFLLLFTVGFWFVGGLVPPPSAMDTAGQIAAFYRDNAGQLRAGTLILLISTPLMVPFSVLLTMQLKRSDPRLAPLAYTQLICGVVTMLELLIPTILIATAAFRPDRPPASTQVLNDVAFTILLWAFSAPALEFIAIGLAILMDRSERPLFPRWSGWVDIAVAVVFCAGGPALFVKGGAFGWDGALAFWAVFASFGLWVLATFRTMLSAVDRELTT